MHESLVQHACKGHQIPSDHKIVRNLFLQEFPSIHVVTALLCDQWNKLFPQEKAISEATRNVLDLHHHDIAKAKMERDDLHKSKSKGKIKASTRKCKVVEKEKPIILTVKQKLKPLPLCHMRKVSQHTPVEHLADCHRDHCKRPDTEKKWLFLSADHSDQTLNCDLGRRGARSGLFAHVVMGLTGAHADQRRQHCVDNGGPVECNGRLVRLTQPAHEAFMTSGDMQLLPPPPWTNNIFVFVSCMQSITIASHLTCSPPACSHCLFAFCASAFPVHLMFVQIWHSNLACVSENLNTWKIHLNVQKR